ncbi:hypothetical protein [Gordonia neofelifaecis]|uniref:Uncharacterized protein n=1 Tax=Gordonia neofelifaecis NRRL B-59395 TaxID=644548 RepID=F1YJK8_9ACTN|nr:hypothetical protein [Gordonia neofelifaecis]EGD55241.1 hypothetical protein SCNU_10224 [Gordonia neofelifaecis NRRL B-59395]
MARRPQPILPAAFNAVVIIAAGFGTGLMAAVPLWFLMGAVVPAAESEWAYGAVCALLVGVAIVAIAAKLSGPARAVALVFPVGLALACALPPLVSELLHAL